MSRRPKNRNRKKRVLASRRQRQLTEMIHRLETQLELLREYSEQAFTRRRAEFYGEVGY